MQTILPIGYESKIELAIASETDRPEIYRMRHDVYAREIGQHAENADGCLTDSLDNATPIYRTDGPDRRTDATDNESGSSTGRAV